MFLHEKSYLIKVSAKVLQTIQKIAKSATQVKDLWPQTVLGKFLLQNHILVVPSTIIMCSAMHNVNSCLFVSDIIQMQF